MERALKIIVRMIHIEGPLKGEIQEFEESSITIGRYPHCLIRFPPKLSLISRDHGLIMREGTRFQLIDHSKNGIYLNGVKIKESAYLDDGDVITFAYGGPKAVFHTEVIPAALDTEVEAAPSRTSSEPESELAEAAPIQSADASVVIQYGDKHTSINSLPAVLGRGPQCDMVIDHTELLDRHIQIFFAEEQYWVKDLTGQSLVGLNGKPIHDEAPLKKEDCLDLTPEGPRFRFLGEGRFFELPAPESSPDKKPMWRLSRSIWNSFKKPSGRGE
ncbi:MAG: FHA domain-containing protein [Desulfobacteraceae bacterium]|nr:MAG: FHA domain-containing protein [Desulfobacteraceae bacterium]